jgi:hypothetical protein
MRSSSLLSRIWRLLLTMLLGIEIPSIQFPIIRLPIEIFG